MKRKGIIFIVSAPSGSGKTTLCKEAASSLKGISRSISMTTRLPRSGEKDGIDYIFITNSEFLKRKKRNEFLEWAKVFGEYYGTPAKHITHLLKKGQDVVLNIDVVGAMKVKKLGIRYCSIFILPPSMGMLKKRLTTRSSDSDREIAKRLQVANKEIKSLSKYDYVIVNDKLAFALEQLRAIIIAQRCRVK